MTVTLSHFFRNRFFPICNNFFFNVWLHFLWNHLWRKTYYLSFIITFISPESTNLRAKHVIAVTRIAQLISKNNFFRRQLSLLVNYMRAVSCAHIIIAVSLEESVCRKVRVNFSAIESRFSYFILSPLFFFKQIRRFAHLRRCLPLSLLVTFQCTFITEVTGFRRSTVQRFLIFEVWILSKLHININPYLIVNTLTPRQKYQPIRVVWRNNLWLLWESYKTYKYCVDKFRSFLNISAGDIGYNVRQAYHALCWW